MKIVDIIASQGVGSSYCVDQRAVRNAAVVDGLFAQADPVTPGFRAPREVPEAICLQILLDDGSVASGDGSSPVFPGRAGIDPPVRAAEQTEVVRQVIAPLLIGRELSEFRALAGELEQTPVNGRRMHAALRWSLTAALLDAVAVARRRTKAEILAEEWGTTLVTKVPPLLAQSSHDWEYSLDRVIMRRIDAFHRSTGNQKVWDAHTRILPWFRDRVQKYAPGFNMALQLDLNGFAGRIFDVDTAKIVAHMAELQALVEPFDIIWASPVEMPDRESQIAKMAEIRVAMADAGLRGGLIADYFCASVDDHRAFAEGRAGDYQMVHAPTVGSVVGCMDILTALQQRGIKGYLAGSSSGTDRAAQVVAHIAAATGPSLLLLTPGAAVDTPHHIAVNEIQRVIALTQARQTATAS